MSTSFTEQSKSTVQENDDELKAIGLVDALANRFNDPEGEPELYEICQKLKDMTVEDKVGFMKDFVSELPKEKKYRELKKILHFQYIPLAEWDTITYYAKRLKAEEKKDYDFWMMLDMFQYGRICGIRQERAKRRGEKFDY